MMGCCTDHACTPETCMRLPEGKTCGDCAHIYRCKAIYGHTETDTFCDWFPRRFQMSEVKVLRAECERLRRGLEAMRAIYQDGTMASNAALDAINEAVVNLLAGREWSDDGSVKT